MVLHYCEKVAKKEVAKTIHCADNQFYVAVVAYKSYQNCKVTFTGGNLLNVESPQGKSSRHWNADIS